MYCGREHQREHWAPPGGGGHKAESKELAAVGWAADLAAAAGCSCSTAAAVMRGSTRVRAETVTQVRSAAEKLHWKPQQRGGSRGSGRRQAAHPHVAGSDQPPRDAYLARLAREVGLACSTWLSDRGVPSGDFNSWQR